MNKLKALADNHKRIKSLDDNELRVKIATLLGTLPPSIAAYGMDGVPDYPRDLNACRDMTSRLTRQQRARYADFLACAATDEETLAAVSKGSLPFAKAMREANEHFTLSHQQGFVSEGLMAWWSAPVPIAKADILPRWLSDDALSAWEALDKKRLTGGGKP